MMAPSDAGWSTRIDTSGRVDTCDVDAATQKLARAIALPCSSHCSAMSTTGHRYLVELPPGWLLQVHRLHDAVHARYKWELRLERVEYTTAMVEFFLFECHEVTLERVYFTDDEPWSHERCHEVAPDFGVLDLTDGTYTLSCGALSDLL
jgi:hypothetical protein